ncbi:MAG: T9SS type A sorting domain-containing protein [Chitinophagaceae bacterium]|nr:T9SS type A sorting domain-containing protein [Chitinophagaceae bacterium]
MKHFNLRKTCFLLVLILVTGGSVFSQGFNTTNWKFSNPKQFGFTVLDVDYFDNNNAIAVGSNGGIAKTTDGGLNWTYGVFTYINPASFKVTANFNDVHYVTSTVAYAVGSLGAMAKTTDGGATWNFVSTPLFPNTKNINACWFVDANKGYIGGEQNNTSDSLPKLYVTLNGGSTWDSIAAPPANGVSRVGYIGNALIPSVLYPVNAKLKEIFRIEFINDSTGYISGSNSYGVTLFPSVSFRATSTTVCTPLATFLTSGSMAASLLWKFKSGVLTDYSLSKERLGYTGINTNTINCTAAFATVTPVTQQYRAMNIINDSTVVLMSFNNNTVVKVYTGKNDSTANVNAPGVFEKGKYEVLNFPFPPTQGPNAGPPIPNPQVLLASNPYQMRRTANGTLVVNGNFGRMFKSVDTGRNWIQDITLPQGQNFSNDGVWAMDIAPNGRFLSMGSNGTTADSMPGSPWHSNYNATPASASYNDMEFIDCNNGIAAGGSSITVTTDGGNTWIDRASPVLAALFANITHLSYVSPTKVYFTTNIGNIYRSANQAVNLSPVFAEPLGGQVNDIAWQGADSLWAVGFSSFSVPTASRQGKVYRSFNNAATWDTIPVGPIGSLSFTPRAMDFPTRSIGYICGTRNYVYKTTDAGATWTDISPFPALTPQLSYSAIQALNKDTIFVIGVGFPRKAVYRTTDGGANWTDITGNILTTGVGNLNGILMHDINNGYVMTPGGALLVTNNGGTSWTLDLAPTGNLFTTAAFVPKTVGPGVSMINRKMLVSGPNISGAPIMEYGNPANTQVNSTELITGAACSTPNSGSITITASGGLAPYTYQLDAGAFQPSNVFNGVSAGIHTITIKDAYCGLLTKTVTVALNDDQVLNTNITSATICAGAPVQLIASGNSTTYSWSPALGLSNPNIANPIATPLVTTTYTVTATLNSCVKTKDVTITVNSNPALVIVAVPGTTLCQGDPAALTVYETGGPVATTLTQSTSTAITQFNSVSCNAGGLHTDNSYWRAYNLATLGLSGPITINTVTFGIEQAAGGTQPVVANLYTSAGAFPGGVRTLVGTQTFNVPNQALTLFTGTFTTPVTVPNTAILVVELFTPSGQATGRSFFIGSNAAAQTGPSYLSAAACGVPNPTDVAAIGFPNMHIILNLGGTTPGIGAIATGTFLWSPAAGLSSTTTNPVAASPAVTTTYTVVRTTPAGCVGSANITLNVNTRPTVTSQPANATACATSPATFTVTGTGTGVTYQWQLSTTGAGGPWVNLANGAPYSGVTTPTLTVNPVTVLMSGYRYRCVLSGVCPPLATENISNSAILTVNTLPVVVLNPAGPVCGGVAGINGTLIVAGSAPPPVPGSVTVNSGAISVPVPDNTPAGATHTLAVSTVPANATITGVTVTWTMPHTWVGDMVFAVKAPNGEILNLDYLISITGPGPSTGFVNTAISSAGVNALSTGSGTYTGTFRADAVITNVNAGAGGPTGFTPTQTTWPPLYGTPNGNWVLAMKDAFAGDVGTLTSWSIKIDYTTPGVGGAPLTYTWSPAAGLYTNATATIPYIAGAQTDRVYAAPTAFTAYTCTGTNTVTGCTNTNVVLVNYTPPAPNVTPSSVTMCLGDPAVRLTSSTSSNTSVQFCSGPINVPVPDASLTGATSVINVSGLPTTCNISAMSVTWNMTHTWNGDMVFVLKAPNGNILNLDYFLSSTGGAGATTGFVNTNVSSTGVAALSSGSGTYTGTFKADALLTGPFGPAGPNGFVPTVTSWAPLWSTPNGAYTLAMYDGGGGDLGVLTSWCLNVTYTCGVPATAAVWTPNGVNSGLFNDAAATIPYTGTPRDTVWTRPTPSGVYPYQVTVQSLPAPPANVTTPMAGGNGNNLVAFNVRNNNGYPVTLSSISSNSFGSGAVVSRAFWSATPIAGNPGPIAGPGWTQFGTANNTVTAGTLNLLMSGLTLTVNPGQTIGIAIDMTGATFPAYTNGTGTVQTYSAGGCDIITDGNVGWGGPAAPGTPANNPRNFNGAVSFVASFPACTSPARTVVVTVNQPTSVVTQPVDQTICTDKVASFTVVPGGSGPFSYQWQLSTDNGNTFANIANGGVYSGATSATLVITAPPVSMNNYQFRCIVTGAAPCASATSFKALLRVNPLPTVVITAAPYTRLLPGLITTISSTVSPNAAQTYSWFRNGAPYGGNTASLTLDVDKLGDYRLRVTDVNGCTNTSNTISILDSVSGRCFVYPNPTNGEFDVRYYSVLNNSSLPRTVTVYNASGERVLTQMYSVGAPYQRMHVDMRKNGKGLYWVEVGDRNGNRLTMCRVVIQ